jgi:alkylated DNA repair dioxygenase AlkB
MRTKEIVELNEGIKYFKDSKKIYNYIEKIDKRIDSVQGMDASQKKKLEDYIEKLKTLGEKLGEIEDKFSTAAEASEKLSIKNEYRKIKLQNMSLFKELEKEDLKKIMIGSGAIFGVIAVLSLLGGVSSFFGGGTAGTKSFLDANGKIDLPVAPIESAELAGNPNAKSWYEYYTTDQNGEKLAPIPQVVKDILQKKLGIDMSVYDSAIINSYGEATELSRHIDNTEDKGNAYKIPIVSISLVGDSVFQYSEPSTNPTHFLADKSKVNLSPGQVVIFGGPSRAMAHRVLNGKSGNAVEIKNSIGSLKTERINITLRRALPLSEQEYNKWVENNKTLKEASEKEKQIIPSEMNIEDKIDNWIEKELPWSVSTPASEIAEMYKKEKESTETIEEFLNRLSCAGKLI